MPGLSQSIWLFSIAWWYWFPLRWPPSYFVLSPQCLNQGYMLRPLYAVSGAFLSSWKICGCSQTAPRHEKIFEVVQVPSLLPSHDRTYKQHNSTSHSLHWCAGKVMNSESTRATQPRLLWSLSVCWHLGPHWLLDPTHPIWASFPPHPAERKDTPHFFNSSLSAKLVKLYLSLRSWNLCF